MQYRKSVMGRPKEIKGVSGAMTLYVDHDKMKDFRELCNKHNISLSEGIRQLITEELEKNAIGNSNPIAVAFRSDSTTSKNTLDYYLDNGYVTMDYFRKELENNDVNQLNKIEALGSTINRTAKQLIYHRQTGKYLA